MCFCKETTTVSTPVPQSGTSNVGEGIKMIQKPFYSQNIATADIFLFQWVEVELADLSLSPESFKKSLLGFVQIIAKDEFTNAFRCFMDHCEKYVCFGRN